MYVADAYFPKGTSIPKMDSIQLLKAKVLGKVPIPHRMIPLIDEVRFPYAPMHPE